MISLNREFQEENILAGYKKLLKVLLDDPYTEGSASGGLHPNHISEIIKHIFYVEKYQAVNFTVSLEEDGYHLHMIINNKEKQ